MLFFLTETPGKRTYDADLHRGWPCPNAVGCITHIGTLHVIRDRPFKGKDVVSNLSIARYGAINPAEYAQKKYTVYILIPPEWLSFKDAVP